MKLLYRILQLLQGSHLGNSSLKTLKLDWATFHSATFQLKCLDFQSNQFKKLSPVLSLFYNGLWKEITITNKTARLTLTFDQDLLEGKRFQTFIL